jgi:hypothetical protein
MAAFVDERVEALEAGGGAGPRDAHTAEAKAAGFGLQGGAQVHRRAVYPAGR